MARQDPTPRTRARRTSRGKWRLLLALFLAALLLYAGRSWWLPAIGHFLVAADPPEKADLGVVLAGDFYGRRILKGMELVREGYVPRLLVDGPSGLYGYNEAELAIEFARKRGAPGDWLIPMPMRVTSTMAEAQAVGAELKKRQVSKVLVITSNFHTRRARAIFRRYASPGVQYRVVAAPDEHFDPGTWWQSRDSQKIVFLEYAKLFAWWAGL